MGLTSYYRFIRDFARCIRDFTRFIWDFTRIRSLAYAAANVKHFVCDDRTYQLLHSEIIEELILRLFGKIWERNYKQTSAGPD